MQLQSCLKQTLTLTVTITLSFAGLHGAAQALSTAAQQRQSALALEKQGDNSAAEAAWRVYLRARPASPEAYAHLGLLEARQGRYKDAVPLYRKALELGPPLAGLRYNLGLALFKGDEPKEAIEVFQSLLKSEPSSSQMAQQLTILIGMAHYGLGEYAEAVPYLKKAAQRDAQNLPLRLALAHSCLWSKQYPCVLSVYHEILLLNPNSAEADMLAGEAQDAMKNYFGALEEFRAAVKADPKLPDVHFGLGYILWTQRQYPEAVTQFEAELANNPNHAQAMTYLGDSQMQLTHPELALPLLERARRIDPSLPLTHLDLGILYADAGRKEEALAELKAADTLRPDDVNVHWRLGRLYRSMGKMELAKAEFSRAQNLTKATDAAVVDLISGSHAKPAAAVLPPVER